MVKVMPFCDPHPGPASPSLVLCLWCDGSCVLGLVRPRSWEAGLAGSLGSWKSPCLSPILHLWQLTAGIPWLGNGQRPGQGLAGSTFSQAALHANLTWRRCFWLTGNQAESVSP